MHRCAFFLLLIGLVAVALPAAADDGGMSPSERRAHLEPLYHQLQGDPQFHALRAQLDGRGDDRRTVDSYLAYLPLSPVDLLEIDMETRRYEVAVPRFLQQWHLRWIELHQTEARALYGDAYVDSRPAELPLGGAPTKMPVVGTNRNMAYNFAIPPDQYQGEIQISVNPNNRRQMVAAANTFDDANGACAGDTQAIFYSADGGATWGYTCAPDTTAYAALTCNNFQFGSDPAVVWNDQDEVFLEYMLLCTPDGVNIRFSIVVAKSTNSGATWTAQGVVANSYPTINVVEDKEFLAVDNNPGSPFAGRMYTCWDRNNNERSAYSTNGGATWTEVDLPTTPSTGLGSAFDLGCEMEVQKDGTVHVVYNTLRCTASCNNEQMFYSRSTNGGVSWSAPVLVRDFNLVSFSGANFPPAQNNRGINPFGSIGVDNSGGVCDGTLYTTFTDWTSGGVNSSDIWVSRSTNNGVTWQAPVRVNDDGAGSPLQFHPFLVVDQTPGRPVVAWHDTRNFTGNQRVDFFVARSRDCGQTFEANIQASQPSAEFNNSTISWSNLGTGANPLANPNQFGEYLGLDAQANRAYIAWTDTRHYFPAFTTDPQRENVGFVAVSLGCNGLSGPTSGRFNLPPSGGSAVGIGGTLQSPPGTTVFTISATLTETSPTTGTVLGTLSDGVLPDPDYDVIGTYTITTPAAGGNPAYGLWEALVYTPGTINVVGKIAARWKDFPPVTNIGKYAGEWKYCD